MYFYMCAIHTQGTRAVGSVWIKKPSYVTTCMIPCFCNIGFVFPRKEKVTRILTGMVLSE